MRPARRTGFIGLRLSERAREQQQNRHNRRQTHALIVLSCGPILCQRLFNSTRAIYNSWFPLTAEEVFPSRIPTPPCPRPNTPRVSLLSICTLPSPPPP